MTRLRMTRSRPLSKMSARQTQRTALVTKLKEQFPVREGQWSRITRWYDRGIGKVFGAIGQWIVKATGKGTTHHSGDGRANHSVSPVTMPAKDPIDSSRRPHNAGAPWRAGRSSSLWLRFSCLAVAAAIVAVPVVRSRNVAFYVNGTPVTEEHVWR